MNENQINKEKTRNNFWFNCQIKIRWSKDDSEV